MIANYWHEKHPRVFTYISYNTNEIRLYEDLINNIPLTEWNIARLFKQLQALEIYFYNK